MDKTLLSILVDPISKTPLILEEYECGNNGQVIEGVLRGENGRFYPVRQGIPRFTMINDPDQKQTAESFAFKWQQRNTYESQQMRATAREWLLERYGFANIEEMRRFFAGRRRILDAGCGSAFSASLWMMPWWQNEAETEWIGVDISTAIDVARERVGSIQHTHFVQGDVACLPFRENTFDTIFTEGVLHHTPSTETALNSLLTALQPGGEILFYVYKKKGPIREFSDDYIRSFVSARDPEEAWSVLRPLTKLGQALAELHAEVQVPEDIPYLGIKAGHYDVQRLIYWHFAKLFWNPSFSLEENNHVHFDWYHPRYAHRHTEREVRGWCEKATLSIIHFDAQESGFTVRAVKG